MSPAQKTAMMSVDSFVAAEGTHPGSLGKLHRFLLRLISVMLTEDEDEAET